MRATRNSLVLQRRNTKGLSVATKNTSVGMGIKKQESLRELMALFLSDGVHQAGDGTYVENEFEPSTLGGRSPRKSRRGTKLGSDASPGLRLQ